MDKMRAGKQAVQKKELKKLKNLFGNALVDLRPRGGPWTPLEVKILLGASVKSDNDAISIELYVMCGDNYPKRNPVFWLANGKGLSEDAVVHLNRTLQKQMLSKKKRYKIFELVSSIQDFLLNVYELPALSNPEDKILHFIDADIKVKIMRDFIEKCGESHDKNIYATLEELLTHPFLKPYENNPVGRNLNNTILPNDTNGSIDDNPSRIDDFTILKRLGKGGSGTVYKAQNNLDKTVYAIKIIPLPEKLSKKEYASTIKEVQFLSQLTKSLNVVGYNTCWIGLIRELKCEDSSQSFNSPTASDEDFESGASSESVLSTNNTSSLRISNRLECENSGITSNVKNHFNVESTCPVENAEFKQEDINTANDEWQWNDSIKRGLYIQMECCGDGKTLKNIIDDEELYSDPDRVLHLFTQILKGVESLHKNEIMHRDLKPGNIFIADDQAKIGDLGLATTIRDPNESKLQSKLSHEIGTIYYRAPELTDKKSQYDQKIDVYSLGIILLEMCLPPCITGMERDKILTAARESTVTIPEILLNDSNYNSQYVEFIRWLLQHNPRSRPNIENILSSNLVQRGPPSKQGRKSIKSPGS